jgi:hypothetical protein
VNTVIYRLPNEDCYGYANDGTKIESVCWDWCGEDIIIHNLMETYGISRDTASKVFWNDVKNYNPSEFADCVEYHNGSYIEALGDADPGINNLREDYLEYCGFTEEPSENDTVNPITGSTKPRYFANMVSASSDISGIADIVEFEELYPSEQDIRYYFICEDADAARQIYADRGDVDEIDGFTLEVSLPYNFSGDYEEAIVAMSPMVDDNGDQSDIDFDDITFDISDRDLKKLVAICQEEYDKWENS